MTSNDCPPSEYGSKRIVLLPVEPHRIHAYWEFSFRQTPVVNPADQVKQLAHDDPRRTRLTLRFHELPDAPSKTGPGKYFDLDIDSLTGSCYVDVPKPGGSYYAELGFRAAKGLFFPAVRSDIVVTPAPAPSPIPVDQPPPAVTNAARPPEKPKLPSEPRRAETQGRAPVAEAPTDEQLYNKPLLPASASPNILALGRTGQIDHDAARQPATIQQPGPLPAKGHAVSPLLDHLDLTEFCEQRFAPGNSSQ